MQLNLFDMLDLYGDGQPLSNREIYDKLKRNGYVNEADLDAKVPVGLSGQSHSPGKRKFRWLQQSARLLGLLERVPDQRGVWRAVKKSELTPAPAGFMLLAFSTKLGLAIWGNCEDALTHLDHPITAVITSPPYLLKKARAYGGYSDEREYVAFLVKALEPVVKRMRPGGTIALNVTNDAFLNGLPARSLYRERLVLALHDELGLQKLDTICWVNKSKPPGPTQWACMRPTLLGVAYEPIYLFTNDPARSLCDNRRVLQPHTDRHLKLIGRGGEERTGRFGDGAYSIRPGSFARATSGALPRNVLEYGHKCGDLDAYRAYCREQGLPVHAAAMPLKLVLFLVQYLAAPGDLVVDLFSGTGTTGKACELSGRHWFMVERILQHVVGAASRFRGCEDFEATWEDVVSFR